MFGTTLYSAILGLSSKWRISNAAVDESADCVEIHIGTSRDAEFSCPVCNGRTDMVGDSEHRWLHDDLFSMQLKIVARIPLISCETCGVNRVKAPWERPGSNFREGDTDGEKEESNIAS
ncbi:MAG TPA: hypothetical protein VN642_07800 [Dongiaceae bacterium]|nr:hypothetical protein [Dongiaceae bacterium]